MIISFPSLLLLLLLPLVLSLAVVLILLLAVLLVEVILKEVEEAAVVVEEVEIGGRTALRSIMIIISTERDRTTLHGRRESWMIPT
jgi:hypothetical protein